MNRVPAPRGVATWRLAQPARGQVLSTHMRAFKSTHALAGNIGPCPAGAVVVNHLDRWSAPQPP
ncbi:hypothetical protein Mal4_25370 [Maioricimonas rarisocia]|uniref:Uncharacterized protein n=1 Tax=Maioricimonas rarisocia TaxID=2528026 RepID=A0A517Z6U8_9PLAN|nr:hypothetical protein Mal4_25370 [Maioricimonas rarisocia]